MEPVTQLFDLLLFGQLICWPLSLPAGCLLLLSLAGCMSPALAPHCRAVGRCYWLLAVGPAAVLASVAIGHEGPPLQWPGWVDWFVPAVVALHAIAGVVIVLLARGARLTSLLAVLGSLLLTVAFAASGTMALTGVGP
jgi:hypothetical protein